MRRYLESSVVILVIGLLMLTLLAALDAAKGDIEEATMQAEVAAMRVELLDLLAHRETFGGPMPATENPVELLGRVPAGYRGSFNTPPQEKGIWYFDRRQQVLVYRFRNGREERFRLSRNVAAPVSGTLAGMGIVRLAAAGPGNQ